MQIRQLRVGEVHLPKRAAETHKGDYGKLLILGGCVGYTGAPTMCARAALRAGAGLVYLGVPAPIYDITAVKNDEAMPFPLPADESGCFSAAAADLLAQRLETCDVAAIGPGMGKASGCAVLLEHVMAQFQKPLVIDADGLNLLSERMELLHGRRAPTILTPHDGEFARLGGKLEGNRAECALRFAETHGCILVLKGHRSIIAFPTGEVFAGTCGNPGMAKGGSGDVLTGVIAAMLCQMPLTEAVTTGVHLHAYAGDLCAQQYGEYAMLATDLIETLPAATKIMTED